METRNRSKPVIGIGLTIGILVLGLLLGLSGEMNPAKGMRLNSGAAPIAKPDTYKYTLNTPLSVAAPGVLANDSDPDGETVTAVPASGPTTAGGTYTLSANGAVTYTPPTGYTGDDSFLYYAIDTIAPQKTSSATIVTLLTNYPPTAFRDTFYYTTNTGVIVPALPANGVLANDTDPEGSPLTAVAASGTATKPDGTSAGTYVLNTNGTFTFSPIAGYTGEAYFAYKAYDGAKQSAYAIVTLRNSITRNTPPPIGLGAGTCMFADCGITSPTGKYCTANDLIVREIFVENVQDLCGPPICNPITNVCVPDTGIYDFGVRLDPNATTLYDIGLWVENENLPGQPIVYSGAMQGTNCFKSYLFPATSANPPGFDSYGPPYKDLNGDQCGDALDADALPAPDYYVGIMEDVKVVCTDELMLGEIAVVASWGPSSQNCQVPADGVCPKTSSKCFANKVPFEVSNKNVDLKLTKTAYTYPLTTPPTELTGPIVPVNQLPYPDPPTSIPYQFAYTVKIENDPDDRGCYRSSGYVVEDPLPPYLKLVDADSATAGFQYISAKGFIGTTGTNLDDGDPDNGQEVTFTCVDTAGNPVGTDPVNCSSPNILQIKVQNNLPVTTPVQPIGNDLGLATCNNQYHEVTFLVEYVIGNYAPKSLDNRACVNGFQYDPWGGAYEYVDPTTGAVVINPASGNNCDDAIITTEVDLLSFQATPQEGSILLEWETASEKDNLGFNIYRATSLAGDNKVQLNAGLIPSNSPGGTQGSYYSFLDTFYLDPNTTYYYWLEDVDFYGVATLHGPAIARMINAEPPWNFKIFLPFVN